MDPNRTLWDLMWAIYESDRDSVVELANALKSWVDKGGFLPTNVVQQAEHVHPDKLTFTIVKD